MHRNIRAVVLFIQLVLINTALYATVPESLGINMESYSYPHPVDFISLINDGKPAEMAYMDIPANGQVNNKTVVLLHGGQYYGAYWHETITSLSDAGFRVIVPDQIGFGKSSKVDMQYTFHQLANNTYALLNYLNIDKATIVGHSIGGMLAIRFALLYPDSVEKLVVENPMGLEDMRRVYPYQTVEQRMQEHLAKSKQDIYDFLSNFYVEWNQDTEEHANVQYRVSLSPDYSKMALTKARVSDMMFTQPVVYELEDLQVPTLLIIGQQDRVTPAARLAKLAQARIKYSELVEINEAGHVPHLETKEQFNTALINFLSE